MYFLLMIRRPPRSTLDRSSAASDVYKRQGINGGLFTDYQYRNNGLDPVFRFVDFVDPGLGAITGDTLDYGKFKTPSLRNIALTAPYMHDGRFATLEEVLDFYSEGVNATPFTDNFMQYAYLSLIHI